MTDITTKKLVGELTLSEEVLTDIDLDSLNLNGDYLPLSGGTVDGNININNGNFVQTTDNYTKAYGRNSFIQAETVLKDDGITPKYQHSSSGTKGFVIIGINNDTKSIKLSGDISALTAHINSTPFSYSLGQGSTVDAFKITNIDYTSNNFGFISVDVWPNNTYFTGSTNTPESEFLKWYEFDDNGLFAMSDSTLGNTILKNFYGQHAEGGSVKAIGKYSHAEGRRTIAGNRYTHAEGDGCKALGQASHAEGFETITEGLYSHAEGFSNKTYAESTHAEGASNTVNKPYGHAEGGYNIVNGSFGHAEGGYNIVNGLNGHAEGLSCLVGPWSYLSILSGDITNNTITVTNDLSSYKSTIDNYIADTTQSNIIYQLVNRYCGSKVVGVDYTTNTLSLDMLEKLAAADGYNSTTSAFNTSGVKNPVYKLWFTNIDKNGQNVGEQNPNREGYGKYSHAEGYKTYAFGNYSHTEGYLTIAVDECSHAEGQQTRAEGLFSHAEGLGTIAKGIFSHAEGYMNKTDSESSHVEGANNVVNAPWGHAEGYNNKVKGSNSHVEGISNDINGQNSHAEGSSNKVTANCSHAEGQSNTVSGPYSHAEGYGNKVTTQSSHAEGQSNTVSALYGHAEGMSNVVGAPYGHAEGLSNVVNGAYGHAEGWSNVVSGSHSHAEGYGNKVTAQCSHAEGYCTQALADYSHSAGCNSIISSGHVGAYVWNGQGDPAYSLNTPYSSNGPRTFNINPIGETKGFYIGDKSLYTILSNLSAMIRTEILNELNQ